MLKIIIAFIFSLASLMSFAQETARDFSGKDESTFLSPKAFVEKFHDKDELEQFNKTTLKNLYQERALVMIELLPYFAFKANPGANFDEMGIPPTKDNLKALKGNIKNKFKYLETVNETMEISIPYADKHKIIEGILRLEYILEVYYDNFLNAEEVDFLNLTK